MSRGHLFVFFLFAILLFVGPSVDAQPLEGAGAQSPGVTAEASIQAVSPTAVIDSKPDEVLMNAVNRVLKILDDETLKQPDKKHEKREALRPILFELIDMHVVSTLVLADFRKKFTDEQFEQFTDKFSKVLFATYCSYFDTYTDQKVTVVGQESLPDSRAQIKTLTTSPTKGDVPVTYSMTLRETDKRWIVYDLRVEEISFVRNFRSQFRDLLMRKTPEQVLAQLDTKNAEFENKDINPKIDEKIF